MINCDSEDGLFTDTAHQQLFNSHPHALVLCDYDGFVKSANPAFEQLFGFCKDEIAGHNLKALLQTNIRSFEEPKEWISLLTVQQYPTKRLKADNSLIDVWVSTSPITIDRRFQGMLIRYQSTNQPGAIKAQEITSEEKYRSIFKNAVEGIFLTTPDGRYLDVNPALAKMYGFKTPEALIHHFKDIKNQLYVDPQRRDVFTRILARDQQIIGFESEVRKKDGSVIWITENARAVHGNTGEIAYYEGTVMDISGRKQAEKELEIQRAYFSQLFTNSPQAIIIIDTKRNVVNCNKGFEELFGYRALDVVGFGMRALIVPEELMVECENLRHAILDGKTVQCETQRRHISGKLIPVSMIGFPIKVGDVTNGITYIYQDISERKSFEEQITHQAFHDSLTNLPNRALFSERLQRALERSRRRPELWSAVLIIDLNKFKAVNDSLGHPAGDQLLIEVGKRLSGSVRAADTVARLGGDEFAIILDEFVSKIELLKVAKRMHSILCEPFLLSGNDITPGASIGIVPKIAEYASAEDVLRDADIAMYSAKQQGKGLVLFDKRMHQELVESISLETELREVLAAEGLTLHYQPILTVIDERLEGFEALVRWDHPLRGLIPPDRFIPLAEETGLIVELGKWVIAEACRTLKSWQREITDTRDLTMSVNVSIRQFNKPGLVEHIMAVLEQNDLNPACLKIEVTESVIMNNPTRTITELKRLKVLGVQIAIDDFGTGYSSLSYLRSMPIDHLKIDRSFISGTEDHQQNDQIVKSIISLARSLGLSVIAEGVENQDQLDRLRSLNCDKAQGYMFSRPVDEPNALNFIKKFFK